MEAVPRLPMLSFELKTSPEATNFNGLKQYIAEYYQEDPGSYSKECQQLEQLRGSSVRPSQDVSGVSTIRRYFCQLHSIHNRFLLSNISENHSMLNFSWKDLFSGSTYKGNIKYEMAAVLYNFAALHTQLGAAEGRSEPESMKKACTHFQCAGWALGHIKDNYALSLIGDLSTELLIFMQHLCFAQAQECIMEKSLCDNRKAGIIAKVTAQIINYYNSALAALLTQNGDDSRIQDIIGSKLFKEWRKYVRFKISYLSCILMLYQGQQLEEMQKMGERVTLYQASFERLEEAKKESKGMNNMDAINEALIFTMDVVEAKRKSAKSENEFIYHEDVPELSSISAVQGANLVNGIGFSVTDPEVFGDDIFHRLVPMKAHESSSLYSEEKASLLRRIGAKIEDRNAELDKFMSSLTLGADLDDPHNFKDNRLPQGLVDRCADLNAKPNAIPELVQSMSNLAEACADVETMLGDIKALLKQDEFEEDKYQQKTGQRSNGGGHIVELNREYVKYQEAHNKAGESNETLRKAMGLHVSNLKILAQPLVEIKSQVPRIKDQIDKGMMKDLQSIIGKVSEMQSQRNQLYQELRENITNDDITSQVIALEGGDKSKMEELFKKELSKHDKPVALLEQNLKAQDNILKALTDVYARCATMIKAMNDIKSRREQFFVSLQSSYDVYEDLLSKSAKGLEFYKKLQGNVQKLLSRVKAACDVQDEERSQKLKSSQIQSPKTTIEPVETKSSGPKLKDYLNNSGKYPKAKDSTYIPTIRPNPLGSENTGNSSVSASSSMGYYPDSQHHSYYQPTSTGYVNPMYQNPGYTNYPAEQQSYPPSQPSPALSNISSDNTSGLNQQLGNMHLQQQHYSEYNPYYDQYTGYNQQNLGQMDKQQANFNYSNQMQQENRSSGAKFGYSNQSQAVATAVTTNIPYASQQSSVSTTPYMGQQTITSPTSNAYPSQPFPSATPNSSTTAVIPSYTGQQGGSINTSADYTSQQVNPASGYSQNQSYGGFPPSSTQIYAYNPKTGGYEYMNTMDVIQQIPQIDQNQSQPGIPPLEGPYGSNQNQYTATVPYSTVPADQYVNQPNANLYSQYTDPNIQYQNTSNFQQPGVNVTTTNQESVGVINQYVAPTEVSQPQYYQYPPQTQDQQTAPYYYNVPSYGYQPINDNDTNTVTNVNVVSQPMTQATTFSENYNNNVQPTTPQVPQTAPVAQTSQNTIPQKFTNIDLLSDIDFHLPAPTLQPQSLPIKAEDEIKSEILSPTKAPPSVINSMPPIIPSTPSLASVLGHERKPSADNLSICSDLSSLDQNFDWESASVKAEELISTVSNNVKNNSESILQMSTKDQFEDQKLLKWFHKEVERLEKFIDSLNVKTLNGTTPLDTKWKEVQDKLVKDESKRQVNVAKLFPEKNRNVDSIPYDHARVCLPTSTDNYINAVHVKDLGSCCPPLILAQTPMPNTVNDFWNMIWSQKSTVVVCIHTPNEILDTFWPQNINQELSYGDTSVTLFKQFDLTHCIERTLRVTMHGSDFILNLSLLQIKMWPKNSAEYILGIAQNIISAYKQQNLEEKQLKPLIMNCLNGADRSVLVTLAIVTILATQTKKPILINVIDVWYRMCCQKKGALRDSSLIQFSYQIVLNNGYSILNKRGIMTSYQMKNVQALASVEKEESINDPFKDLDPLWKLK